jgi:hypothetical protein
MFDNIKKALETVTDTQQFSQSDLKKLFCGLAKKHFRCTQEDLANYLRVSRTSVTYYLHQHSLADKNTQYHNSFKEAEAVLITLIKKDEHS